MPFEALIETYGYPVVLLGAFLEGETVLVMGGFAAYRGYLNLSLVILCAFVGTFCSDQLFFYFGHKKGPKLFAGHPKWERRAERVQALLDRYQLYVILGFRFVYGIRNITPFVIGASGFKPVRFLILNFLGALLWATTVGSAGFIFGRVLELLLADLKKYEIRVLIGLAAFGTLAWLWHVARSRLSKRGRDAKAARMAEDTGHGP